MIVILDALGVARYWFPDYPSAAAYRRDVLWPSGGVWRIEGRP